MVRFERSSRGSSAIGIAAQMSAISPLHLCQQQYCKGTELRD